MRLTLGVALLFPLLLGCASIDNDRTTLALPIAARTQVNFSPLDREQAKRFIELERHTHKKNTDPMREELAAIQAGRKQRFEEIAREFPECGRQRHCQSKISRGSVQRFERYNELAKEILEYDRRAVELDAAIQEWGRRLDLRIRAILNRFLVHQALQIPEHEHRFQSILVYSLESFDTRRRLSQRLLRFSGNESLVPAVYGDLDFRMLGRPVDEAAVLATFEVYLMPHHSEPLAPTRYVVSMLVNTHQIELQHYDKDFMREWAGKLAEPSQESLRLDVFCGMYSIASDTLLPRLDYNKQIKRCADRRVRMQAQDAGRFGDRFPALHWMLPLAYYPMNRPGD
jgi:hypothetical protein